MDKGVVKELTGIFLADPCYCSGLSPERIAQDPELLTEYCLIYSCKLPPDFLARLDEIVQNHHSASDVTRILTRP